MVRSQVRRGRPGRRLQSLSNPRIDVYRALDVSCESPIRATSSLVTLLLQLSGCLRCALHSLVLSLTEAVRHNMSFIQLGVHTVSDAELAPSTDGYSRAGSGLALYSVILQHTSIRVNHAEVMRSQCAAGNSTCPIMLTTATRLNPALDRPVLLQGIRRTGEDYEYRYAIWRT